MLCCPFGTVGNGALSDTPRLPPLRSMSQGAFSSTLRCKQPQTLQSAVMSANACFAPLRPRTGYSPGILAKFKVGIWFVLEPMTFAQVGGVPAAFRNDQPPAGFPAGLLRVGLSLGRRSGTPGLYASLPLRRLGSRRSAAGPERVPRQSRHPTAIFWRGHPRVRGRRYHDVCDACGTTDPTWSALLRPTPARGPPRRVRVPQR